MKNLRIFSQTANSQTRFLIAEYSAFFNSGKTLGHVKSCYELYLLGDGGWEFTNLSFYWAMIEVYGESRFWKEESPEFLFSIYRIMLKARQIGDSHVEFPAHTINTESTGDLVINYREGDIYVNFNHLRMEENNMKYKITSTALRLVDWAHEDGKYVADVVTLEQEVKVDTIYQDGEGDYLNSKRDFSMYGNDIIQIHGIIPTDWKESK